MEAILKYYCIQKGRETFAELKFCEYERYSRADYFQSIPKKLNTWYVKNNQVNLEMSMSYFLTDLHLDILNFRVIKMSMKNI